MLDDHRQSQVSSYVDRYKRTPLHWACIKGASAFFLNALIENYPEATVMKDYLGRTPLHLACEYASDQGVFALLRVTDPVVTKYRDSENLRSLLAVAIINLRSPLIIDAILQADKTQIVMKDLNGNTPIVLFFRLNLGTILGKHKGVLMTNSNLDDLVDSAAMLLQAEVELKSGIKAESHKHLLSNAIRCTACPFAFVSYVMMEFREQIGIRDVTGDYPIHSACRAQDQDFGLYKCDNCQQANMRHAAYYFSHSNLTLRHVICDECIQEDEKPGFTCLSPQLKIEETVNAILIEDDKYASVLTKESENPLIVGLKCGQSWSQGTMEEIIRARPSLLYQKDAATELYPYQLAAMQRDLHYGDNKADVLTTTFEILKRWPLGHRQSQ